MKTASLIAFVILAPLVHAQPKYRAINLGVLPGTHVCVGGALNNLNQVVGRCRLTDGSNTVAFVWTQATGMQSIATGFYPAAINDSGVVVGIGFGGIPAKWTAISGVQMLQGLPSGHGAANSVNASGYVAGTYINSAGTFAFLWNPNGTHQEVPLVNLYPQFAAVNDSGTIVGMAGVTPSSNSSTVGFEWTPSSGLQTFQAVPDTDRTLVAGINNQTIVGAFYDQRGHTRAFVMSLGGQGRQLEGLGCTALSVNSSGQIVGSCGDIAGRAMLWQPDGTRLTIRTLLVNNVGIFLPFAYAINNLGAIGATNFDGKPESLATFLLVPVQ